MDTDKISNSARAVRINSVSTPDDPSILSRAFQINQYSRTARVHKRLFATSGPQAEMGLAD